MRATSLCILFELRRNGDQLSVLRLIASLKIVHFQSKQYHKRTIARSTGKRLCDKVSRANQPGAQHKATQNHFYQQEHCKHSNRAPSSKSLCLISPLNPFLNLTTQSSLSDLPTQSFFPVPPLADRIKLLSKQSTCRAIGRSIIASGILW